MCESLNNPYYTDTAMFEYWPKEILCGAGGLKLGKCDEQTGECVCNNGYSHDLTFARYRTCNLPNVLLPIWFGLQFPVSVATFVFTFRSYKEATSIARLTLLSNLFCLVFHMLYCIFQFGFHYKANSWMFISLYFIVACLSASNSIALFSLMSPLSAAALRSSSTLKNSILLFFFVFRLVEAIPFFIALSQYDDVDDPAKDKGWNNMVQVFTLLVAFEVGSLSSILIVYGTRMVHFIEQLSKNLGTVVDTRSKVSTTYIKKVKVMIWRVKLLLPNLTIILCLAPVIQLATNYIPFNYVFVTMTVSCTPIIVHWTSKFATKSSQKVASSSSNEMNENKAPVSTKDSSNKSELGSMYKFPKSPSSLNKLNTNNTSNNEISIVPNQTTTNMQ